jgi:nucleotide-binding universal stress UspA family protein
MPFDHILVAIDGSQGAQHALTKAIELARLTGANLTVRAPRGSDGSAASRRKLAGCRPSARRVADGALVGLGGFEVGLWLEVVLGDG